jgi:VWFA-related protein
MMPLLFVLWLGVFSQADQDPTLFRFGVEVHSVYADVFVKSDGKPVTGLTAGDFEVLDNDIPQEVELVNHQDLPLAAILLLDASGSVAGERLDHLKATAHAFIERLGAEDEVGLLTFTRQLQLRLRLGRDVDSLHRVLEQPMPSGETSLCDALYAGLKLVEGRSGRPLIVLFTDGLDSMSWLTESEILEVVKASEAVVYAVSFKPTQSTTLKKGGRFAGRTSELTASDFLQRLTSLAGGRVWDIDSDSDLKGAFLSILDEMQSRYLIGFQPRGVPQSGWHSLKIRVKNRKADEVRARPCYFVGTPQR